MAVNAGVAMAAGDHAAIDGALHNIDVHLVVVALQEFTPLVLFDRFTAAAIEIGRDAALVIVLTAAIRQYQIDDDGWDAALLLPELSVGGDVHLYAFNSVVDVQPIEKCMPEKIHNKINDLYAPCC